jgi:hypothetical protein
LGAQAQRLARLTREIKEMARSRGEG